jgi:N-acetylmuramoyl-L-alanine amidase
MPMFFRILTSFLLCAPPVLATIDPIYHEGEKYVRLEDMAAFYGGEMVPTPADKVIVKTRRSEIQFKPDSREVRLANTIVWLHEPMIRVRGNWAIREGDALSVIDPIIRPSEYLSRLGSRIVVLDPGHGGQDTGAKGRRGAEEKRAALDIARRVKTHLVAAGIKVYLTREGDRFVELEERSRMAKRWGADLFVSIHLNSAANSQAQGAETFVLSAPGFSSTAGGSSSGMLPANKYTAASTALGFSIQQMLIGQAGVIDRGVKRARFIVLKNAPCPAALVECGFLSHPGEEQNVMKEVYREQLARGIAKGVLNYVGLVRQSQRGQP